MLPKEYSVVVRNPEEFEAVVAKLIVKPLLPSAEISYPTDLLVEGQKFITYDGSSQNLTFRKWKRLAENKKSWFQKLLQAFC